MSRTFKISLENETDAKANPTSFTYNEGTGVKDTIVMTGPLSTIYTRALALAFSKTDPTQELDGQQQVVEKGVTAAMETAAIDTVIKTAIIKHFNQEVTDIPQVLPDTTDLVENPTMIIVGTDQSSVSDPETIEIVTQQVEDFTRNSDKEVYLFVGPDVGNPDKMTTSLLTPEDQMDIVSQYDASQAFKRATESFFQTRDIKVLVGFESLVEMLKKRSKK